jgi:hypothetical protein
VQCANMCVWVSVMSETALSLCWCCRCELCNCVVVLFVALPCFTHSFIMAHMATLTPNSPLSAQLQSRPAEPRLLHMGVQLTACSRMHSYARAHTYQLTQPQHPRSQNTHSQRHTLCSRRGQGATARAQDHPGDTMRGLPCNVCRAK